MDAETAPYSLCLESEGSVLSAQAGDVVLLTGAVGSGKTLFLHRLAGLAELPAGHRISLAGKSWPDKSSSRRLCMHFDRHPPLWMAQYVEEELAFGTRPRPTEQALTAALARWRLGDIGLDDDTEQLNRLQAVRLSLAGMDVAQPLLALLDNPTDALPVEDAALLRDDVLAWAKRSRCIVVVACNRWQDWQSWARHVWHIPHQGAWPLPEAAID